MASYFSGFEREDLATMQGIEKFQIFLSTRVKIQDRVRLIRERDHVFYSHKRSVGVETALFCTSTPRTSRHTKQKPEQADRIPARTTTQLYQHSVHDIPLRSLRQ